MSVLGKTPKRQAEHHVCGQKVLSVVAMRAGLQMWVGRPPVAALVAGKQDHPGATVSTLRQRAVGGLGCLWMFLDIAFDTEGYWECESLC